MVSAAINDPEHPVVIMPMQKHNDLFGDLEPLPSPIEIIDSAIARFAPDHVYGMLSGGYDSFSTCHILSKHPRFDGVIHINTGIGVEETRQFVRDSSRALGWKLLEYAALESRNAKGQPDPQDYRKIVLRWGFPGSGVHSRMYARLKERALRTCLRDLGGLTMLVTGIRRTESRIRMGYKKHTAKRNQAVWCNPIFYWNCDDPAIYILENTLPRNPVKELLGISGECLCGCFAGPDEKNKLRRHFPRAYAEIASLEQEAEAAGVWCRWGVDPPQTVTNEKRGQMKFLPLCVGCERRRES